MSGAAQYEERGGLLQRAHHASSSDTIMTASTGSGNGEAKSNPTSSTATSITEHDYRFPRRPTPQNPGEAAKLVAPQIGSTHHNNNNNNNNTKTQVTGASSELDKLDFSAGSSARKELLRESFFPTWKDDSAGDELDSPDEMQKKDPLATQIWRLYSKTKKQLPNQERMENLTWRMMAMSLRKRKQEEAARYVSLCDRGLESCITD
jgi:GATA-binding protein